MGDVESNVVLRYGSRVGPVVETFVRDSRLQWVNTKEVGLDGFLYGDMTQLYDEAFWNDGMEYRLRPRFIFRVKLPDNGMKVLLKWDLGT